MNKIIKFLDTYGLHALYAFVIPIICGLALIATVVYSHKCDRLETELGIVQAEARIQHQENEKLINLLSKRERQIDDLKIDLLERDSEIANLRSILVREDCWYASDLKEVITMVASEAGNQSLKGQMAVAQCIYDRYMHQYGGATTIHEVLVAPGQFTTPLDNIDDYPKAYEAVIRVFLYGERIFDKDCIYFYNPEIADKNAVAAFERNNEYLGTIGDHVFRSW